MDRSVVCLVSQAEASSLVDRSGSEMVPGVSALYVLDAEVSTLGASPGGSAWEGLDDWIRDGDTDLIVVSDQSSLLTENLAYAVIEMSVKGAAVCRLSQFLNNPQRVATQPPSRDLVEDLLAVISRVRSGHSVKRALDVVLAGVAMLVFAVPFALIALAIKLESRGPVFFVQERLGRLRVPFQCIKFRTMRADAEERTGPTWASAGDPRITRVGNVLRRSRLDEVPQLINVIRGEMSLVGTRPIRKHFADQLADRLPFYDLRFLEKPGLTGWAQVKYRYAGSFAEQIEKFYYDYYYLKNRRLSLDFYIIILTAWVVFVGPPNDRVVVPEAVMRGE